MELLIKCIILKKGRARRGLGVKGSYVDHWMGLMPHNSPKHGRISSQSYLIQRASSASSDTSNLGRFSGVDYSRGQTFDCRCAHNTNHLSQLLRVVNSAILTRIPGSFPIFPTLSFPAVDI